MGGGGGCQGEYYIRSTQVTHVSIWFTHLVLLSYIIYITEVLCVQPKGLYIQYMYVGLEKSILIANFPFVSMHTDLTEPVLDVRVYNITATSAAVMWSYVDTCKAVVGFQISLKDFTGAIVSNKSVPAGSRRAVLTDLRPLAQYQVLVMIKIKGGSISTAAMKVFNAGRRQSDDIIIQGGDSARTCKLILFGAIYTYKPC